MFSPFSQCIETDSGTMLKEPPIFERKFELMSYYIIKVCIPLGEVVETIQEEIGKIKETYEKLYQFERNEKYLLGLPYSLLQPPYIRNTASINKVEITKPSTFEWMIDVSHLMTNDNNNDKRNYAKIEILLYRNRPNTMQDPTSSTTTTYYICMNRLSGKSHVYFDLYDSFKTSLKRKKQLYYLYKLREPLLLLQYVKEDSYKTRYVTNEYIMREICSFIGFKIEEKGNEEEEEREKNKEETKNKDKEETKNKNKEKNEEYNNFFRNIFKI